MSKRENFTLNEHLIKEMIKVNGIMPAVYRTIDSTNLEMKRRIRNGDYSASLILADEQTMGRGRLGRSFESPSGSGVYMSLLLRPELIPDNVVLITSSAAVAVCRAIMSLSNIRPEIKWVNDIFVNGRKVCGILAEAVTDKDDKMNVVLGIGINVTTDGSFFSDEVKKVAGALFDRDSDATFTVNQLAAAIVNEFMKIYGCITTRDFINDYRKYSMVIGKNVRYLEDGIWHEAKAVDVDNDGGLIVENTDGHNSVLRTGEITLRIKED